MALQSETVAIPISKGVDLTSEPRLIQAPTLLEAINSRFSRGGGSTKRRGYTSTLIRGESAIPTGANTSGLAWVFGYGLVTATTRAAAGNDSAACGFGPHPNAGRIYGLATRDQETVLWSGDRMFSYTPGQQPSSGQISAEVGNAVMPSLHAYPLGKVQTGQTFPDFADNGVLKIVSWINPADHKIHYSIYDSVTFAAIVTDKVLGVGTYQNSGSPTRPYHLIPLGPYIHIVAADAGDNLLKCFTISNGNPNLETYRSYGACLGYDFWKVDETSAVLAINTDGTHVAVAFLGQSGATDGRFIGQTINVAAAINTLAVAVHPSGQICVVTARNAASPKIRIDFATVNGGTATGTTITTLGNVVNITVAPKYVLSSDGLPLFDVFFDSAGLVVTRQRVKSGANVGSSSSRFNVQLASKAFRAGDRVFVWTGRKTPVQSEWLLMDELMLPVGHQDFVIANVQDYSTDTSPMLSSVNWYASQSDLDPGLTVFGASAALTNLTRFHYALGFRVRVPVSTINGQTSGTGTPVTNVFTEPSIRVGELNMLPTLRSAQAGRCTYFAGAQVWSYDGVELVEQGFHAGPEVTASVVAGGTLSNPGSYSYRVDLCYKNAQNEEVRSLSILTASLPTTGTNKKITLIIPTIPTRRTNSYFLIYRNAVVGGISLTNWWLLNSRNPTDASFLPNDPTVASVSVTDDGTVTDAGIQVNELHPALAGDIYLQPTSAPACEIISAGRDRVWVAGGELPPGQVAPSRLFSPYETPAWNAYLNVQVDRSSEFITAIGFVGDITAFFRKNSTYVMDSDGPDNSSQGSWAPARLALADLGALGQESLALTTAGLIFQSPAGFRLLGPGGKVEPIGVPVDSPAKVFKVGQAVVIDLDQEVRWYGSDQTFVYNYLYDVWSTWTVTGVGAVRDLVSGRALVARGDGYLWAETEGAWLDGTDPYTHRVRLPWLHGGQLGDFQRVRRISGIGRPGDGPVNHTVRVELFYDDDGVTDYEERFEWSYPANFNNTDTWGAGTWGGGFWGDTKDTSIFTDNSWSWVHMPARQKCSVISIAVEDAATPGPGFVLNAIGLELARKPGLIRVPERGGTDVYKG